MGGVQDRDDDIRLFEDGTVEVKIGGHDKPGFFVFTGEHSFVEGLLEYLVHSVNFFALRNTYDEEERTPEIEGIPIVIPKRVWQRNSLDPVYTIWADVFHRKNEVTFSYSRCPDKLWRLRMFVDNVFYSAERLHRAEHALADLLSNLEAN